MDQPTGQDTKEVLLGMYKEANQMLTEKVKQLSIENANLKKQISAQDNSNKQVRSEGPSHAKLDRDNSPNQLERLSQLEQELNVKELEISKLRAEADVNARKILFLSHYATSMRHESPQSRKSAKRRLSDLTDRERSLHRKVSDECVKLIHEKVDPEQTIGEDLKVKFREAVTELERTNQEMLDKFKSDFLELKQKLFSSIHANPDLDS